jgi:hypothetical protein
LLAVGFGLLLVGAGVLLHEGVSVPIGISAPASPLTTAIGQLDVSTSPPGSELYVDGRGVGSSPAQLDVTLGRHTLAVQHPDAVTETHSIEVGLAHKALDLQLWRVQPTVRALRPALPGAAIADARFLVDGRLGLVVSLPGDERQAWTLDPANRDAVARLGSVSSMAPLAIRPDGQGLAFPRRSSGDTGAGLTSPDRLDEVWVADPADIEGHAVWRVDQPDEQLVDEAWAPDGRHLLVVGRQQPNSGMERTTLRWLDTATSTAQLLALLPSEVVPGSYVWRPDGHALAFLVHTASLSAVCTLSDTGEFHYLGDLGHDGTAGPPVAPVAWGPDGQLVYAALKPAPATAPRPLGLGSSTPIGLFLADASGASGRPFGTAEGLSPTWWPDGRFLLAGLPTDRGTGLRLRELDAQGQAQDMVSIDVATPSLNGYGLRWDLARQRALVVTNRSSFDGGHDYTLLDFGWSDAD